MQDVIALLNFLEIKQASIVGWSDGAVTALRLAMRHPSRVDRIFAFGANKSPSDLNEEGLANSTTFPEVYARLKPEYDEINPAPDYETLSARIGAMQSKEPEWNEKDFSKIPTKENGGAWPLVWIVDGDHEEAIKRQATLQIFDWVCIEPSKFNRGR
jgi:pimeloyl-ACP methyl ester carboxylesterase